MCAANDACLNYQFGMTEQSTGLCILCLQCEQASPSEIPLTVYKRTVLPEADIADGEFFLYFVS